MGKREQLLEIMEDAAKCETKATLRARIAALEAQLAESPQEDEAVAWLYDWTDDDGVTHTEASVQSVRTVNFKPVFNVRPLYTHPPAPAVTEALREALEASVIALDDWLNIHSAR